MRRVLWPMCAVLFASGGAWLAMLIWRTSAMRIDDLVPQAAGAIFAGLTLARAHDRRRTAMILAAFGTAMWTALQLVAHLVLDSSPWWAARVDGSPFLHFGEIAVVTGLAGVAAAAVPLRGRYDHRLLWIWISALLTLGTMITPILFLAEGRTLHGAAIVFLIAAPSLAGALTQWLAPDRMIWTCGGGALIFVLLILDQYKQQDDGVIGPILGIGIFILLGALGARIAWWIAPRTETRVELPTATTR